MARFNLFRDRRQDLPNAANTASGNDSPLAKILEARDTFEEAVSRAKAYPQDSASSQFVDDVRSKFQQFATEAQAPSVTQARLDSLVREAKDLERDRAYLYPQHEIQLAVDMAMRDMQDWGVPADSIERMKEQMVAKLDKDPKDLNTARATLRTMWDEYDAWSDYVDHVSARLNRYGWILGLLIVATLALAFNRFVAEDVIYGFVLAGFSGALLSVISKLPPLSAYGALSDARRRIVSRIATGLLAAVVGAGVFASGIVTLQLPLPGSVATGADLFERCGKTRAAKPPESAKNPSTTATTSTSEVPSKSRVSLSPTSGNAAKEGPRCTTGNIFLLMGLAIVLGFAERALPSFADKLLPGGKDAAEEKRGTQSAKGG